MTTLAGNVEDEQRRAWHLYAARLRGLQGAEYDRAEKAAWAELQRALQALGVPGGADEHESV